jgi:uncharacterized protein
MSRATPDTVRASLIETDGTNLRGRTRAGRPSLLRHAALLGLFAAGLLTLLIIARGIGQLKAQSFSCLYAHHPDEKAVCHDPLLSRLDEELASVYRRLFLRLPKEEGEQLYTPQSLWRATRMH